MDGKGFGMCHIFFIVPFFRSWFAFVSTVVSWPNWALNVPSNRYGGEHIIKCVINNRAIFFSVMVVAVIVCHVLRRFIYIFPLSMR